MDDLEDFRLHGEDHEAGKTIAKVRFYRGEFPSVIALLERNAHEVGFSDNLGKNWVQEKHQEFVGVERHRSSVSNRL